MPSAHITAPASGCHGANTNTNPATISPPPAVRRVRGVISARGGSFIGRLLRKLGVGLRLVGSGPVGGVLLGGGAPVLLVLDRGERDPGLCGGQVVGRRHRAPDPFRDRL